MELIQINWNPATDKLLTANYDAESAVENKKINKKALQESLGLEVDDHKNGDRTYFHVLPTKALIL